MRSWIQRHIAWCVWSVFAVCNTASASSVYHFKVSPSPRLNDVPRIGINLGHWTSWGAEQLATNVLKNPGFETVDDRALVIVNEVLEQGFTDSHAWLGRPDEFWTGGRFDVRTGRAAGRHGRIASSRAKGRLGLPEFKTLSPVAGLKHGDVVALSTEQPSLAPPLWWVPDAAATQVRLTDGDTRPGSPGRHAARLESFRRKPAVLQYYLDAIRRRAGSLLDFDGRWQLSFWVKAARGLPELEVTLGRVGRTPALRHNAFITTDWRQVVIEFDARDTVSTAPLELRFASEGRGVLLLDDVSLAAADDASKAFRGGVIAALKRLRPGYLRDWQGQLGDSLENRLAPMFARRVSRYRPGGRSELEYGYSLPEFVQLSAEVEARPWVVVPTTWRDNEFEAFGAWLRRAQKQYGFREWIIEFGNEHWNPLFRPAGIPDPVQHGAAAERAFRRIRAGAGDTPIQFLVNGQFANPRAALEFSTQTPSANLLGVAPYFANRMHADLSRLETLRALFRDDRDRFGQLRDGLAQAGRGLAVYEVNLHTVKGDAEIEDVNALVTGTGAASALAMRLLEALEAGALRQCVYVLSGHDTPHSRNARHVELFGITRHLKRSPMMRPTGQAVELVNRVFAGALHPVSAPARPGRLRVAAFKSARGWSLLAVSGMTAHVDISVELPDDAAALPSTAMTLHSADPLAAIANDVEVGISQTRIRVNGRRVQFKLPAHGLVALPSPTVPGGAGGT